MRLDAKPDLGHLESDVMQVIWDQGENNVRGVAERLERPRAYTTVMTTLDRLFKKGLLKRCKRDKAFFYSPDLTRQQWERKRTDELLAGFFGASRPTSELLISCLVEAVGKHDESLLTELEEKIKAKRDELAREGNR